MKRSRLDTVLRLRAIRERQARVKLAESLGAEQAAARGLAAAEADFAARQVATGSLSAGQLRGLYLQGVRSAELLEKAAEAHRKAQEKAALDRLGWSQASAEQQAVERLTERRRREAADLATRVADDALDDLVGLLRVLRSRT
ncbi:MAG: hypothetical protein FWJ92_12375 [Actinomycetes bacterium]|nr:hypothetical protein [Acidimicrobiia bacterium]